MPLSPQQVSDAQRLYDPRATTYDASFHTRFARHMVELANLQPGENVLDLACGTGLATYYASTAVGATGSVVGVDVSTGMLAQARDKLVQHPLENVELFEWSILELDTLNEIKGRKFDVITCCSALVLLPHAAEAVKQWVTYLTPGGRLVVDVTHPQNLAAGVNFERVGRILDVPVPHYRLAFQKPDDLSKVFEEAGLARIEIIGVSQQDRPGMESLEDFLTDPANPRVWKEHSIDEADAIFEAQVDCVAAKELGRPEIRHKAKEVFKQEWAKVADADGKVRDIDCVCVGIGYKPRTHAAPPQ